MTYNDVPRDTTASTDPDGVSAPTLDELFDALAHPHRRLVVRTLEGRSDPASLPELVRHVGARERNVTVADVGRDRQRAVRAELVHVHLPKLVDYGLVTVEEDTVEPAKELAPICDAIYAASRSVTD